VLCTGTAAYTEGQGHTVWRPRDRATGLHIHSILWGLYWGLAPFASWSTLAVGIRAVNYILKSMEANNGIVRLWHDTIAFIRIRSSSLSIKHATMLYSLYSVYDPYSLHSCIICIVCRVWWRRKVNRYRKLIGLPTGGIREICDVISDSVGEVISCPDKQLSADLCLSLSHLLCRNSQVRMLLLHKFPKYAWHSCPVQEHAEFRGSGMETSAPCRDWGALLVLVIARGNRNWDLD
jgi:hypothetical protein